MYPTISLQQATGGPHVVFSGGVTGGHLFPGLAVAEQLRVAWRHVRITFCSLGTDWERRQLAGAGESLTSLRCGPVAGRWFAGLRSGVRTLAGAHAACRFLRQSGASVVVGLGGYASLPAALAAIWQGVPLVLVEQNAIAGRANRLLAPGAAVVCAAFGEAYAQLRAARRFVVTGTPIRPVGNQETALESPSAPLLVVLGGSHGSQELNRAVPLALSEARTALTDWRIVHQAGAGQASAVARHYADLGLAAEVREYVDSVPQLLTTATLVITRGGGTTLAELAAAAVPTIVCPWSAAIDNHQMANAKLLAESGAVSCVPLNEPGGTQHLAQEVCRLAGSPWLREVMARALVRFARPDAAGHVAHCIAELVPALSRLPAAAAWTARAA